MSEEGWKAFLQADGVDDWVMLHAGATAVFRVGSLGEAAALAVAIAEVPGLEEAGALLTVVGDRLTVRLTRDIWQLEPHHVDLARAISAVARGRGVADRGAMQEVQIAISAKPAEIDLGFWRAVLGYAPLADDNAVDPRLALETASSVFEYTTLSAARQVCVKSRTAGERSARVCAVSQKTITSYVRRP